MRRLIAITVACILAVVVVSFVFLYRYRDNVDRALQIEDSAPAQAERTTEPVSQTEAPVIQTEPETPEIQTETAAPETEDPALHREDSVYTFLQGPVAWESKAPWSGIWCESELDGGIFSVFGCGLCDLASTYSSLTPYECSPLDMYALARKVTDYSPGYGAGAIDWPYMAQTLEKTGFTVKLKKKDQKKQEIFYSYDFTTLWPVFDCFACMCYCVHGTPKQQAGREVKGVKERVGGD